MREAVAALRPRTGLITGHYDSRAGERVWIVAWDDRQMTRPIDLAYADDLAVGHRVQLVGNRLERRRRLTPAQQRQLQQLLELGALDRESAKGPYAPGMQGYSPMVIGRLRDLGLADTRTVGNSRTGQHTVYWLSEAGAAAARGLSQDASSSRQPS